MPATDSLKRYVQRLAYSSGALDALHRRRNRDTLTVTMFHRVLPDERARSLCADPGYTVSDSLFDACLGFFARHYRIVSLGDVVSAAEGGNALPERALLITFDDGWADNEIHALPILRKHRLPACVFVVADAVDAKEDAWWEESLFLAVRSGQLTTEQARLLWHCGADTGADPPVGLPPDQFALAIATRLHRRSLAERARLLETAGVRRACAPGRDMMTQGKLRNLVENSVAIGSHGASHVPIPDAVELDRELSGSRLRLQALLGIAEPAVVAMSFPHGRYSAATIDRARSAGYKALFTSDAVLNATNDGCPLSDTFGRISIEASAIAAADGTLMPERLATWLFDRPAVVLDPCAEAKAGGFGVEPA